MALPPRPYKVSSQYATRRTLAAIGLFALGLGGIIGAGVWTTYVSREIRSDQALWATGVLGNNVHVSGEETSHEFIINAYSLKTEYTDASGAEHSGKLSFDLLFSSISDGTPVFLKYDPSAPSRHTVSWAVEHVGARYGLVAFMDLVFGGLFGVALLVLARRQLRLLADARHVAERSDEVLLEVVSVKPIIVNRRHKTNLYVFNHTVAGRVVQRKQQIPMKEEPLYSDEQRTHLVALVSEHASDRP